MFSEKENFGVPLLVKKINQCYFVQDPSTVDESYPLDLSSIGYKELFFSFGLQDIHLDIFNGCSLTTIRNSNADRNDSAHPSDNIELNRGLKKEQYKQFKSTLKDCFNKYQTVEVCCDRFSFNSSVLISYHDSHT